MFQNCKNTILSQKCYKHVFYLIKTKLSSMMRINYFKIAECQKKLIREKTYIGAEKQFSLN